MKKPFNGLNLKKYIRKSDIIVCTGRDYDGNDNETIEIINPTPKNIYKEGGKWYVKYYYAGICGDIDETGRIIKIKRQCCKIRRHRKIRKKIRRKKFYDKSLST